MQDIQDELDRAIGSPLVSDRALEAAVAGGRRSLRRRRLARSGGVAGLVCAVAATAWLTLPSTEEAPVLGAPRPAATSPAPPEPVDTVQEGGISPGATLGADGEPQVSAGWRITQRIDNPLGRGSVAVAVTDGETTQWFCWDAEGGHRDTLRPMVDGKIGPPFAPHPDYSTFAAWVDALGSTPTSEGVR